MISPAFLNTDACVSESSLVTSPISVTCTASDATQRSVSAQRSHRLTAERADLAIGARIRYGGIAPD